MGTSQQKLSVLLSGFTVSLELNPLPYIRPKTLSRSTASPRTVISAGSYCLLSKKGEGRRSRAATRFTRERLEGRKIYLELDKDHRDRYRRLLAYVWFERGDGSFVMLNELLLRKGLAELMTIPPNVKYLGRLKRAYRPA